MSGPVAPRQLEPTIDPASPTGTSAALNAAREPRGRIAARLLLALLVSGAICLFGAEHFGRVLHGPATIVGYPIYADFDPNHYLVAYYFVAIGLPLLALGLYQLLASIGPLRRAARRRRHPKSAAGIAGALEVPASGTPVVGAIGGAVTTGALLGLELGIITSAHGPGTPILVVAGAAILGLVAVLLGVGRGGSARRVAGLELLGVFGCMPLLYAVSERTVVVVSPGAQVVHYRFFPWWLLLVVLALGTAAGARSLRKGRTAESLGRGLVTYLVVPLMLFLVLAAIPGPLSKMDAFGEGEYLGGSYLLLHGYLPWRDLYLIHGVLDDGLKPLVGYGLFGMTRWGATAGVNFIWAPAYWIATYLFAALVFGRRWVASAAAAGAVVLGVFVDWDVRYLFWPLALALFACALRRRSWRVGALLGLAVLLEALLIPEMLYGLVAVVIALIAYECYERRGRGLAWGDFPRTIGALGSMAVGTVAFLAWLAAIGGVSGFIGYYSDFASAHSLSGGVPLFTDYALPGQHAPLGVLHFAVLHFGWLTRYPLELALPILAALATFALFCALVRGGRAPSVEDWVTLCAAGLTVMYYPKGLSRADTGHIGESFAVTVPLLMCLTYRALVFLDAKVRVAFSYLDRLPAPRSLGAGAKRVLLRCSSPVGFVVLGAILLHASGSLITILEVAPSHFRAAASTPPAAVVAGAGGLGYESDALPSGLLPDLEAIIRTYAGPTGAVFDFTNAPGVFDFLLGAPPASRFYDVNLTITDGAQQQAVRDLESSRPRLVVFEGVVGMPRWDFLENEVRDHIVAEYLLSHYRPLALVDGELVLISDSLRHLPPLPRLSKPAVTKDLYYSQRACAFGYVPDFLPAPSDKGATTVPLVQVAAPASRGLLYRLVLPKTASAYHYLQVTRSDSAAGGALVVSNLRARSRRDISWVAQSGRKTLAVEVGTCLQWHGFAETLYVRYSGPGVLTSVSLLP